MHAKPSTTVRSISGTWGTDRTVPTVRRLKSPRYEEARRVSRAAPVEPEEVGGRPPGDQRLLAQIEQPDAQELATLRLGLAGRAEAGGTKWFE